MRILGIDPGLAIVGYGIIDVEGNRLKAVDYGAIITESDLPFPRRLEKIYMELDEIINKYQPDQAAFEELFFNKNITTAMDVSHARGVQILACLNHNLELYEYTPLQIKQGVVGYGRAEKHQVQEMVKMLLNLSSIPKPDDVADGLAVAITHGHSRRHRELFRME